MVGQEGVGRALEDSPCERYHQPYLLQEGQEYVGLFPSCLSSFLLILLFLLLLPRDGVLGESGGRGFEPKEK